MLLSFIFFANIGIFLLTEAMGYRIIIADNRRVVRTLEKGSRKRELYESFLRHKKNNASIKFPKRYINTNGIFEVQYYVYLVEEIDDSNRESGETLFGKYIVVKKDTYNIEERFWMFGYDSKKNKKQLDEVAAILFTYNNVLNYRQALVLRNKLVVYNEERFDMVICKCDKDAQRLHHILSAIAKSMKYTNIIFMGTCADEHLGKVYETIQEFTGWSYLKVTRSSTRP
jgi:hypothetical protein